MRRRRPKRRWLRWLLLLIVIDAARFIGGGTIRWSAVTTASFATQRRSSAWSTLIKAVIWQESRFDEKAVGQAGEIGLMQLMELAAFEWADEHGVHDFEHAHVFDPRTNILPGRTI